MNENNQINRVDFGEDFHRSSFVYDKPKSSGIIGFFMKYSGGYLKDEKQTENFVAIVAIIATIIGLFSLFNTLKKPAPPPENYNIVAGPNDPRL